jgi:hypothetical protein
MSYHGTMLLAYHQYYECRDDECDTDDFITTAYGRRNAEKSR